MAPVVHWMKDILHSRGSVYLSRDTIPAHNKLIRASTGTRFDMLPAPMEYMESHAQPMTPENIHPGTPVAYNEVLTPNKYQLWPRMIRKIEQRNASDDAVLPLQGRSPSSLSDTSVPPPGPSFGPTYRASLSSRRKISVPELRRKPAPENFEAPLLDSPTIPGRPPLRSVASDLTQHERSSSCPEEPWTRRVQEEPLDVKPQEIRCPPPTKVAWPLPAPAADWMSYNPTRPLSPIFSPIESTTPISTSPPKDGFQIPPQVPSKLEVHASPLQVPPRKESLRTTTTSSSPPTHISQAAAPKAASIHSIDRSSPTRKRLSTSPKLNVSIPGLIPEEFSPVDRGRTLGRSKPKPLTDEVTEYASLPSGLRPLEAAIMLPEAEKDTLRKQATSQAERFEILGAKHVSVLSKELRNLDERCEYLRKTYKSLRAGRQKLHSRLLSYLKSESLVFSKDRLLKQEEALVELDRAIDDWSIKLERAENRRLRVRQKLLEHVAASMMLNFANVQPGYGLMNTPPPSGNRMEGPDRKDIESIKIYADNQVLNLFTDIEQAIGRMCETPC